MGRKSDIKSKLKDGDIVLVNNTKFNVISKGIQWFTGGRYNHCVWYCMGRVYHWTMWTALKDKMKVITKRHYKLCIMRYRELTHNQIDDIRFLAEDDVKKKKKYAKRDYMGHILVTSISKIPFIGKGLSRFLKKYRNPWRTYDQKVCSSGIVGRWFKDAGLDLRPDISEEYVDPEDIRECKKLVCIYEEL